ncbi:MAG: chaperone modulator CbpM [Bacillota bacterium]|nr:chaperone modulator CbpM [Bacillota bacterium]
MKLIRIHYHNDIGENITTYRLEIHPDLLTVYKEMGLVELEDNTISFEELRRLQRILRVKRNCGVNTVGAGIIVDLLEKIENLQDEIERLRRK